MHESELFKTKLNARTTLPFIHSLHSVCVSQRERERENMSIPPPPPPMLISRCLVFPEQKTSLQDLKLSVSDLPMLSCHYIQKGVLLPPSPLPSHALLSHLRCSLSQALVHFPPLAGRLTTHPSGHVYITCNDSGVDFVHATAPHLTLTDVLSPVDVPDSVKGFFAYVLDGTVSYQGHSIPLLAVQVTQLADHGIFIGCAVNHAVTDGTSYWNFFNAFAEACRGAKTISRLPDFSREFFKDSAAVLKFPQGGPVATFAQGGPLRERIFHFSKETVLKLKLRANGPLSAATEILGKQSNDEWEMERGRRTRREEEEGKLTAIWRKLLQGRECEERVEVEEEISSFQSLCAQLWRSVTQARKLPMTAETTFRMAVNWRQRVEPKMDAVYFGNAIQSVAAVARVGEVVGKELGWCAGLLNKSVRGHGDREVRRRMEEWEREPRCFPLGNLDGASINMGSSHRLPMYDGNDFGWGRPLAVRSGRANKFDGKISAFPSRDGVGGLDLEVCLAPDTMAALEADPEFMQYVTTTTAAMSM